MNKFVVMDKRHRDLRTRLLQWHRNKKKSIKITDLLSVDYQAFRNMVNQRTGKDLDYYDAIKEANMEELEKLDNIILEDKLNI